MKTILIIIAVIYLGLGAVLFFMQRSILYLGAREYDHDLPELLIESGEERIKVLVVNPEQDKAIVYFGGNAEPVIFNQQPFEQVLHDHTVYLVNYRGYGGSTGKPTESGLYLDALTVFDNVSREHITTSVIGRSLGSGVATYLASQRNINSLVLVTPFDSVRQVAQAKFPIYPMSLLLLDQHDSLSRAKNQIKTNTLIIAATDDQIVPIKHAINLHENFPNGTATMRAVDGANHNNLSAQTEYWQAIRKFFDSKL